MSPDHPTANPQSAERNSTVIPAAVVSEQASLDEAMRRADELLLDSLQSDERRRKRRRFLLFTLGGFIMAAVLCGLLWMLAGENKNPSAADRQQAGQLSQQGWQAFNTGQFAPAGEKFQQAVQLDPKNIAAWNGLGWSQFNSNQYAEAKKSFQALLELDPQHGGGLNGMGWAQLDTGDYANSEATFKKLLKIDPAVPGALNGLGQLYLHQRKYDEAEKFLLKAAPKAPAAWSGLARLYLVEGKFAEAAPWAKKLVAADQGDDLAKQMLKAAQEKNLPDELRKQIEPPPLEKSSDDAHQAPSQAPAQPPSNHAAESPTKPATDAPTASAAISAESASWGAQLVNLNQQDWRAAFALGQQLAELPPDVGFAALHDNWSKITSVDARQQLLKAWCNALPYPLHARNHPRILAVLDLGMRDPSPEVQKWAISYLRGIAFQDFADDFSSYQTWYAAHCDQPPLAVISDSLQHAIAAAANQQQAAGPAKWLADPQVQFTFRDVPEVRQAAIAAGLPAMLEKWIAEGAAPGADPTKIEAADQALRILGLLKIGQSNLERIVAPLLDKNSPAPLRIAAIEALEGQENHWAVDRLLDVLQGSLTANKQDFRGLVWAASSALATLDEPKAIPTMIAVIDADNTYDTVYGVGYFGLGKLTGVAYDETHDGKWWRAWWEKNKARFPAEIRDQKIPDLAGKH